VVRSEERGAKREEGRGKREEGRGNVWIAESIWGLRREEDV